VASRLSSRVSPIPFHNAPVLLVPAYAVVVAAPSGPDQGCPSPRQITDALMARIPAVVVSGSEASTPGMLRLSVTGGTGTSPLSIELTDQGGEARLYRNLTLAERGRGNDCPALAETVALIVDRFLHDLGYEAPLTLPPPLKAPPSDNLARAPPRTPAGSGRLDLFAGGFWRGASTEDSDVEVGLGLGFERGLGGRRLSATFSGGISSERSAVTADESNATLRRLPVRFGLFVPLPAGQGQLEPGVRLGLDFLFTSLSAKNGASAESHVHASPSGELVLAYRIAMARRLFVRFSVSGGAGIPYNFMTSAKMREFGQPRFYAKSGLELGFSFQ
jgi:hypothetical protein